MDLISLKGVGKKSVENLNSLGIESVEDLLHYFPMRVQFMDYTDLDADVVVIKIQVVAVTRVYNTARGLNYFTIKGMYFNKLLTFKVYNQPYLNSKVKEGSKISVECRKAKGEFAVSRILFDNNVPYANVKYSANSKITSNQIKKFIVQALYEHTDLLVNPIDDELFEKYRLLGYKQAVYLIHNPKTQGDYNNALRTLKYIEAYNFMKYLSDNNVENLEYRFENFDVSANVKFINNLDFELTDGQKNVVRELLDSVVKNKKFNFLIHGDVGCGKTLVSIIATNIFTSNSKQVAILCPTEVLAKQMYQNYINHISGGVLLTSSTPKKEVDDIYKGLSEGTIQYVVGTHSLLNDKVEFNDLGLVVIDEQHRFGVKQREKLISKSNDVNTILMSATPIPRTVGLILYDNIRLLPIHDLPKNRIKITTKYSESLNDEIIADLTSEIEKSHQVFVVVPMINESDLGVESIEAVYDTYLKYFYKKDISVIHGKLKQDKIDKEMEKFYKGKTKIMIATSIIEVGIDVKSASRIVIHSASRFGLATLHQLRGRVGRSNIDSSCYVINEKLTERIELFVNCDNGFEITEADYKMRGFGNLVGIEQSGYNMFKLLDVFNDLKIIECAKHDVESY